MKGRRGEYICIYLTKDLDPDYIKNPYKQQDKPPNSKMVKGLEQKERN